MTNKTLFDAVEGELRNARAALNTAGAYIDMLRTVIDTIVEMEEGEYLIPLSLNARDGSLVYGLPVKRVNRKIKEYSKQV